MHDKNFIGHFFATINKYCFESLTNDDKNISNKLEDEHGKQRRKISEKTSCDF